MIRLPQICVIGATVEMLKALLKAKAGKWMRQAEELPGQDPDRTLPPDMNAIGRRRNDDDDDDDDDDWERLSLPNLMPIVSSISSHHTLTVVRYDIYDTARENFFHFGQCGSPCLK